MPAVRRSGLFWIALAAFALPVGLARAGEFEVPPALSHQVEFWKDIFATYGKGQFLIHDTARVSRVYSVLDFRHLEGRGLSDAQIERAIEKGIKAEKKRIRLLLTRLDRLAPEATSLTVEEMRIRQLFKADRSPHKFRRASARGRIRAQAGLRERLARGIAIGHGYFPHMEAILGAEGVPVEITRLPLVESSFDTRAYSKAGAAGMWQFIPSTGRRFMTIDAAVDQRLDPFLSTRAAARFLRENYEKLGSWPLAILAYNHGPAGVARAVRQVGSTDVVDIIQRYRSRTFKFASRNFYPEFLAALEVERNHADYFGRIELHPPLATDVVPLGHFVPLKAVVKCAGGDARTFADLNPGLLPSVHRGKQRVPRGYGVRLPLGTAESFERCYAGLSPGEKFSRQRPMSAHHRVRRGETLTQIARRYGSTVEKIRRHNKLRNKNFIRTGQVLRIPAG